MSDIPLTSPTFLKAHDKKAKLNLIQFNNLIIQVCSIGLCVRILYIKTCIENDLS